MSDEQQKSTTSAPSQDSDMEERVKGFEQEFIPLLGKYELGLSAEPIVAPDGRLTGVLKIFSTRKKSVEGIEEVR